MSLSTGKAAQAKKLSGQDVQAQYSQFQSELQALAQKIGELETEADEHELVLKSLEECQPDRKCFRLVGGVLVERTVKDVAPALQTNRDGIRKVLESLIVNYKKKEEDFHNFQHEYGIKTAANAPNSPTRS
ncbi:hypothetical protein FRC02_006851 [Tulasnella sp. 418]|nr:hypothetical protein FRC02_006851 [Tulasnella sp. 418]